MLTSDSHKLSVKILSLEEVGEDADRWDLRRLRARQRSRGVEDETDPEFGLRIAAGTEKSTVLPVDEEGTLLLEFLPRYRRAGLRDDAQL